MTRLIVSLRADASQKQISAVREYLSENGFKVAREQERVRGGLGLTVLMPENLLLGEALEELKGFSGVEIVEQDVQSVPLVRGSAPKKEPR